MNSIAEIESELIEEFEIFDDPMDQYAYIIDIGKALPPMEDEFKIDNFIVKGCQSKVWLIAQEKEGKIFYQADSNTVITKGIIALLVRVLSGQKASDIKQAELHFIEAIGLRNHLTSQRSNGLTAMIEKMKFYADLLSKPTMN